MIIQIKNPDPAWAVSLQTRAAVLWIGPDWKRFLGPEGAHTEHIQSLISHPWAAVFVDASDLAVADLRELTIESLELVIRLFDVDPTVEQLPPNRLPVYFVRGPNRTTTAGSQVDPKGMLNRLKMLARMPAGTDLFVIGISSAAELAGIAEARSIAQSLRRIIVVDTLINSLEAIDHDSQSIVHWLVGAPEFFGLLTEAENLSSEKSPTTILIRTPTGSRAIDIGKAIDPSYPLTQSFELITARDLLEEHEVSIEDVERFLGCPAASWAPYALGIPWPRHQPYVNTLLRELDAFQREGPAASFTAWITAEDGSGATTTLRQVCFSLAREGFPVLLAKPSVERYDYSQLNSFLVQAVGRIGDFDVDTAELPWIIAFDADHTQLHWEFVSALCNGLKKLLRSVVVLAIRSKSNRTLENRQRALGTNRELSPELQNSITPSDAEQLGRHFMSFLPPHLGRSRAEWVEFIESTIQTTMEGRRSLFWVALRFWLFRVAGSGESLRSWLARKVKSLVDGRSFVAAGLLEVAALSRHRLAAPYKLLPEQIVPTLLEFAQEEQNALGFRQIKGSTSIAFAFAHPLIAEEVLRIAASDALLMGSLDKFECLNLADLELHIFARILSRPTAASPGCIEIIEELVTTALRVDPREAPASYGLRDRIVRILEAAPDAIFDASQIFNHHLAKARRHLALDPPDPRWGSEARLEQLELAVNHVRDAMYNIQPTDDSRREASLNLWVTLALTYDARSRLEQQAGRLTESLEYEQKAAESFLAAQKLDADNTYVLENFARFMIRRAKSLPLGEERARLVVDAISLLEWEQIIDATARRAEPVLTELASAYELLVEGSGRQLLLSLADKGSEPALVALSHLAIRTDDGVPASQAGLREADDLLKRVPVERVSWRSLVAHYRVVSRLRPNELVERLEFLRQLNTFPEFAWPQQLRLEYGILLHQLGDHHRGKEVFQRLREELRDRSGWLTVPRELRFLADPSTGFCKSLRTAVVVKSVSNIGRNLYGIPKGWGSVDVLIRPFLFGRDSIRVGQELDCLIQFTNFGPQAVPPTVE